MASSTNPTDEGADEIKIFRRSDTDDADSAQQPSHQLTEDKKAVAYETELETSKCTPSSSASSIGNRDGSMAFIISAGSKSGAFKPTAASGMSPGAYSNLQHLWLANMQPFFWNYHNGQSYALPPYASSFLSGRPMQQQSSTGPPPAHNGSATAAGGFNMLSLDPTSVKSTASPTYPSPYYHPYAAGAALSPSFVDLCSRLQMAHSPASPLSPAAMIGHHQHQSFKPSDFMLKSPANNSLGIPLAPSVQQMMRFAAVSSSANNPLNSINQMRLPNMTTPITSMANSLATAQQHHHNNHTSSNSKTHHNGRQRASHGSGNNRTTTGSTVKKEDGEKHIKKPLNAFMWFMKENRPKLMEEQNYKERQSAELNKELGRRWHNLAQDEQQKYYAMAREERAKHMALHPGWTARDNYAINKKKKRKRDKSLDNSEMKKCRARFGLEHQHEWCKHCKRKKRCLWSNRENSKLSPEELSPPAQVSSTTQGSPAAVMTPSPFSASMHPHSIGSVLKLPSSHGYNAERLAAAAAVVGLIAPPPPPSAPTAAVGASEQSNNNNKSAATPHHSNGTAFVTSSTTRSPRRSHLVGAVGHPSDNDDDDVDDDDDEEEDEDDESDCGVDGVDPREAAEALAMAID